MSRIEASAAQNSATKDISFQLIETRLTARYQISVLQRAAASVFISPCTTCVFDVRLIESAGT
ncbi:MAG: hypothetical protein ACJ8IR_01815 [Alphaproteobacteria bacterium]